MTIRTFTRRRRIVPLRSIGLCLLLVAFAVSCTAEPQSLPFDLTPQMAGLRQDASAIAVFLARERMADAVAPADRLTRFELPTPREPGRTPHPDLVALASEFHSAAEALEAALVARDKVRATERFDALVVACTECHRQFRPGGVVSIELAARGGSGNR